MEIEVILKHIVATDDTIKKNVSMMNTRYASCMDRLSAQSISSKSVRESMEKKCGVQKADYDRYISTYIHQYSQDARSLCDYKIDTSVYQSYRQCIQSHYSSFSDFTNNVIHKLVDMNDIIY